MLRAPFSPTYIVHVLAESSPLSFGFPPRTVHLSNVLCLGRFNFSPLPPAWGLDLFFPVDKISLGIGFYLTCDGMTNAPVVSLSSFRGILDGSPPPGELNFCLIFLLGLVHFSVARGPLSSPSQTSLLPPPSSPMALIFFFGRHLLRSKLCSRNRGLAPRKITLFCQRVLKDSPPLTPELGQY